MIDSLLLRRYVGGTPAPAEPATVAAVLRRLTVDVGPDGLGSLFSGDGGEATIDVSGLRTGDGLLEARVHVEVLARGLVDLVYEIAAATGMTVAAEPGRTVFLTDGDQADELPDGLVERAHTCVDGAELHWWLVREARTSGVDVPPGATRRPTSVTRADALRSLFGAFRRD